MPRIDSFEAKTKRQKIFQGYWFFKMIYGRGNTYLSIPVQLAGSFMMFTLWMKLYIGIPDKMVVYSIASLILLTILILGFIDIRKGIFNEEQSYGNRYNPELMYIRKQVENAKARRK